LFLHRLGRDLGIADIDGLAAQMGARSLQDWIAFYLWEQEETERARMAAAVA